MQNSRVDRAKQFMPFAALRGYYDLIRTCERVREPKKELLESECEIISAELNKVKKGMMIRVKYYNIDAYDEITGMVSEFDDIYKTVTVVKTKIPFDDIESISVLE